jgi:hypothetical protein
MAASSLEQALFVSPALGDREGAAPIAMRPGIDGLLPSSPASHMLKK